MKALVFRLQAALLWAVYHLFVCLPVDRASALGGWLGRNIGYWLPVTRLARDNIGRALPELAEPEAVLKAMWDHLGRTAGEFAHADRFSSDKVRLEVVGGEYLDALRGAGQPALLFSGHLGNWELSYALGERAGLRVNPVYRAPDNPYVRWLFEGRSRRSDITMIPKGPSGARQTLKILGQGGLVAMFVDQKMNDGISVPFFGRPAMTAPALASLALKFDCPVIPFRIKRLEGAHFRAEILPPRKFIHTGDRARDVLTAMTEVNRLIEDWIRDAPEQWLWVHRRWPRPEF